MAERPAASLDAERFLLPDERQVIIDLYSRCHHKSLLHDFCRLCDVNCGLLMRTLTLMTTVFGRLSGVWDRDARNGYFNKKPSCR